MLDLIEGLLERGGDILLTAVFLIAIAIIVVVWVTTRAIVPTLAAILFGGFVIWAVNNLDFDDGDLPDIINDDIQQHRPGVTDQGRGDPQLATGVLLLTLEPDDG